MIPAIRSELRKFFTTRMWWGIAIAMFLAGAAFAVAFAFLYTLAPDPNATPGNAPPTGTPEQIANSVYTSGLSIGYLLTLTIGVLQIGAEYRHKTITSTVLGTPRRATVMGAKVIALLVIGAIYGLISLVGSVTAGAIVLNARGHDPFPTTGVLRSLALSLLVLGLWALIGLGAGILIPNQVAALLITIGVAWIVEPLAGIGLTFWDWSRDHIVPYLPTQATGAIVSGVNQGGANAVHPLTWWGAALVLAGYAAVLTALGSWRTVRADIS